jgi:hypothetical protein
MQVFNGEFSIVLCDPKDVEVADVMDADHSDETFQEGILRIVNLARTSAQDPLEPLESIPFNTSNSTPAIIFYPQILKTLEEMKQLILANNSEDLIFQKGSDIVRSLIEELGKENLKKAILRKDIDAQLSTKEDPFFSLLGQRKENAPVERT